MLLITSVRKRFDLLCNLSEFFRVGYTVPKNVLINGRIKVYGKGNIQIGEFSRINSGEKYNPIGGQCKTIFSVRNGGRIKIGAYVGISNSTFVARNEITIQNNVRIGGSCKIYDNDFHSLDYDIRISENDTDIKSAPVLIKEGAFIGAHTIILKGVTIGRHSIVGAGSVITKPIPDGEIWAGNPAHFIGKIKE